MRERQPAGLIAGLALMILAVVVTGILTAQRNDSAGVLKGSAAFGDWRKDKPGVRRLITPADLPPPNVTPSVTGFPETVPMPAGAKPTVPAGFAVEMVTAGLNGPRVVRVAPNGDIFVAESKANTVRVLRAGAGGAGPSRNEVFLSGLSQPYGIAFYPLGANPQWVYIANSDSLVRVPLRQRRSEGARASPERIVERIPWQHHWTRDIAVSPDGKRIFYSVGSGSNVALDMSPYRSTRRFEEFKKTHPLGAAWDTEERRGAVLAFDPDGKNEKIFATGIRNCAGLTIQPATGQLWCVVNERDELGDNLPSEYATTCQGGRVLRLALVLHRRATRTRGTRSTPRAQGQGDGARRAPAVALGVARIAFYDGDAVPGGVQGQTPSPPCTARGTGPSAPATRSCG